MRGEPRRPRRCLLSLSMLFVALFALIGVAAPSAVSQQATPTASPAVDAAAAWLVSQQAEDGSYAGFDGEPDPGATADAVIALAAARQAGTEVDLSASVASLEANALVYAQTGPGQAAKLALAVVGAGGNPRDVATVDPVALFTRSANEETGLFGFGVFDHALIVLAHVAANEPVPAAAIEALRAIQIDDGSWAFDGTTEDGAGDSNTTAVVIQALVAMGAGDDPLIESALGYLRTVQADGGGFTYQPADPLTPDANSTALVVQALIAAGEDPASDDWNDAAGALIAFQNPSGAFRYTDAEADDNFFATVQALPAVAGLPLPIVPAGGVPVASPAAGG
ncbi:MAG: cell wall anchor protein [Thermomicrobiales bacterium]